MSNLGLSKFNSVMKRKVWWGKSNERYIIIVQKGVNPQWKMELKQQCESFLGRFIHLTNTYLLFVSHYFRCCIYITEQNPHSTGVLTRDFKNIIFWWEVFEKAFTAEKQMLKDFLAMRILLWKIFFNPLKCASRKAGWSLPNAETFLSWEGIYGLERK